MKAKLFIALVTLPLFINSINAQQASTDSPHNGLQFSMFMGGAFGDVKGTTSDGLNPVFRGSGMHVSVDIGYAANNWSVGFFGNLNGVSIKSIEVNDTAYAIQPGYSMDNSISGLYICRYFMPLNAYIRARFGIGRFTMSDADFNELGSTDKGFGWGLAVGKDFLIGKKKNWGIGGFVSLTGIKCHDLPPFDNDTYSYFAPGFGIVVAYR